MSRYKRLRSSSGYYHVMLRGNERKTIFQDDEDRSKFLESLSGKRQENRYSIHALCLMDNHVHLMLCEGMEDVSISMKRINVSYVNYYNKKYARVGHLFQDRFRSEPIEDDSYLLSLARYIHQNPVAAGITNLAAEFKWSSYNCYLNEEHAFAEVVETGTVLGLFSEDKRTARKLFEKYMNEESKDVFMDIFEETEAMNAVEAKILFQSMLS